MKNNKRQVAIKMGQLLPDMNPYEISELMTKLKSLARAHQKQCENACNGEGFVKGQRYYNGVIDDYAKRTYGETVMSAYHLGQDEVTVFDTEIERIEEKVKDLMAKQALQRQCVAVFQGDPRGATVKVRFPSDRAGIYTEFCPAFEF